MELITGIAENIVAGAVTGATSRALGSLAGEIARRPQLAATLTGRPGRTRTSNRPYDPSLEELRRIIANETGEYKEPIVNFLRELKKTAIPDAIADHAFLDQPPDPVFPAFDAIYKSCGPLPFESKNLFNAFYETIRLRTGHAAKDRALLDVVRAHHRDTRAQIQQLAASLGMNLSSGVVLTAARINDARIKLARYIENTSKFLNVETVHGVRKVTISKLIIPGTVSSCSPPGFESPNRPSTRGAQIPAIAFRRIFERAIILGDPGGGKSTFTQNLCFELSRQIFLENKAPHHPEFLSRDLRLPMRLVLRSLEARRRKAAGYNILDYLVDEYKGALENNKQQTLAVVCQLLSFGSAVLIFDGLDEILDVESRREMVVEIEAFCSTYASCSALVTSRLVGYCDAPLSEEFSTYQLQPFDRQDVFAFSRKLIAAVKVFKERQKDQIDAEASRFVEQTERVASDLRQNPLMLGLMVHLFCIRGNVPLYRPEIYKECAVLMFEKWDPGRAINFPRPTDFDLLDLFGYLAREIYGDPERENGVPHDWLETMLRGYFQNFYVDKARAVDTARSLAKFVTGRAWVMCDIGARTYKFTHRTFLEFFFARDLVSASTSVKEIIMERLLPRVRRSEWDVIAHLALHSAVFRDAGKAGQAADTLMSVVESEVEAPDEEVAVLSFVASALEYLVIPEKKFIIIARSIFERCVCRGFDSGFASRLAVFVLISKTRWREHLVRDALCDMVEQYLKAGSREERLFCVYLFSSLEGADFSRYRDGSSTINAGSYFSRCVELMSFSVPYADGSDISFSRAWFAAFPQSRLSLYAKLGASLVYPNVSCREPPAVGAAILRVLWESINGDGSYRRPRREAGSAGSAGALVAAIASDCVNRRIRRCSDFPCDAAPEPMLQEISSLGRYAFYRLMSHGRGREKARQACDFFVVWLLVHEMLGVVPREWQEEPVQARQEDRSSLLNELERLMPDIASADNFRGLKGWFQGNYFLQTCSG